MSEFFKVADYGVNYNARDLILYALSIGIGSSSSDPAGDELRFLYENHPQFECFPTFCLALTFWAEEGGGSTAGIPNFPPPLMRKEEVIPRRYLVDNVDLSTFPLIHSWQSVVWDQEMPVPTRSASNPTTRFQNSVETKLDTQVISVAPKSVGTFVTSQTQVAVLQGEAYSRLCTMHSTALVLGVSSAHVQPFDTGIKHLTMKPQIPENDDPIFEWVYPTVSSQALFYRLTSGDSNHIHVDTSAAEMLHSEKKAPLLHGLFTLAIGCRAVSKLLDPALYTIQKLEGKFSQPAFVGDVLKVRVWKDTTTKAKKIFLFVVVNDETDIEVLRCGYAEFVASRKTVKKKVSKL
jgi:acyl dehydratase